MRWVPAHSLLAPNPRPQPHLPISHVYYTVSSLIFLHILIPLPRMAFPLLGLANLSIHVLSKYVIRLTMFQAQCWGLAVSKTDTGLLT